MQEMRNSSPSRRGQQKWIRSNEGFRINSPRKDEDLALFHDMRTRENRNFLHPSADDIEASLPTKLGGLTGFRVSASQTPPWKRNDLLATDSEKNDYDWLLTPPGTPLFPSLDNDSLQTYMERSALAQPYSASKVSRFLGANITESQHHKLARRSPGPRTPPSTVSSASSLSTISRNRAPSPSRGNSSPPVRPATPVKTLSKSTTTLNRASTRSSPPILRRTNTSPSFRSSSAERNPPSKGQSRPSLSPKLQAWQAPELGFSAEPPPNLRTSLDRPTSSMRLRDTRPRQATHVEGRHSYSETVDRRQSHAVHHRQSQWRNSSSSASKVSSSTTSQDRWSSRGSMISSSDDGTDVLEPTFLDFSLTSPSSASATTSTTLTGRLDSEVSSKSRLIASRQRRSASSSSETAGFTSASARKSLESSMQRMDNSRLSQTMFRPLLSSAPTTSFYNVGHTLVRHRPTGTLVEPSIIASSNASSEKGVRIFPGAESSDDGEGEAESEWDKSLSPEPVSTKFEGNRNNATHDDYNQVQNNQIQYDRESVADSASCVMGASVVDGVDTIMYIDALDWSAHEARMERDQTSCEVVFLEEGKSLSPPMSSTKEVDHYSMEEDTVRLTIQHAHTNREFVDIQEEVSMQLMGSTPWLYRDSVDPHECNDGLDIRGDDEIPNSQESINLEWKGFHEPTCKTRKESDVRPLPSTQVYRSSKPRPHGGRNLGMGQPVFESITHAGLNGKMYCSGEEPSVHPQKMMDLPVSIEPSSVVESEDFSYGRRQLQVDNHLSKNPLKQMKSSTVIDVNSLDRAHKKEGTFLGSTNSSEGVPDAGHTDMEGISRSTGSHNHPHSNDGQELEEDPSSCPSTLFFEEHGASPQQSKPESCQENYIDVLEIQEKPDTRDMDGITIFTPKKLENGHTLEAEKCLGTNEAERCSATNEADYFQVHKMTLAVNLNAVDNEHIKKVLSQNDDTVALVSKEEHNCSHGNVLINGLSFTSQDIHSSVDLSLSTDNDEGQSFKSSEEERDDSEEVASDGVNDLGQMQVQTLLDDDPSKTSVLPDNSLQSALYLQLHIDSTLLCAQIHTQEEVSVLKTSHEEESTQMNQAPSEDGPQQPFHTESPSKPCPGWKPATPSFSLEEATNTILFCSSIVHDMVYKATAIATEKEAAIRAAAAIPLSYQLKGRTNTDFISSLRGKVLKSEMRKGKRAVKTSVKKAQGEHLAVPITLIQHPTLIEGMEKGTPKVEAEQALPDNVKEKSFMGLTVNSNCQCTVM